MTGKTLEAADRTRLSRVEEKQLQAACSVWLAHVMPTRQQRRSRILFFNLIIYYYYYFVIRTPKTRSAPLADFKVDHAALLARGTMPYSRPLGLTHPAKLKLCILSLTPPFLPPPDKYVSFKFSVCVLPMKPPQQIQNDHLGRKDRQTTAEATKTHGGHLNECGLVAWEVAL